jgi:hypothetical protein
MSNFGCAKRPSLHQAVTHDRCHGDGGTLGRSIEEVGSGAVVETVEHEVRKAWIKETVYRLESVGGGQGRAVVDHLDPPLGV